MLSHESKECKKSSSHIIDQFPKKYAMYFQTLWNALKDVEENSYCDDPVHASSSLKSILEKCPDSIPEILSTLDYCRRQRQEDVDFKLGQSFIDLFINNPSQALSLAKCFFYLAFHPGRHEKSFSILIDNPFLAGSLEKKCSNFLEIPNLSREQEEIGFRKIVKDFVSVVIKEKQQAEKNMTIFMMGFKEEKEKPSDILKHFKHSPLYDAGTKARPDPLVREIFSFINSKPTKSLTVKDDSSIERKEISHFGRRGSFS